MMSEATEKAYCDEQMAKTEAANNDMDMCIYMCIYIYIYIYVLT